MKEKCICFRVAHGFYDLGLAFDLTSDFDVTLFRFVLELMFRVWCRPMQTSIKFGQETQIRILSVHDWTCTDRRTTFSDCTEPMERLKSTESA